MPHSRFTGWIVSTMSSVATLLAVFALASTAHAQGFLERLEQRVQGVIDGATERAGEAREEAVRGAAGSGYLGLTAEEDPASGMLVVVAVKPNSPAQRAGIRVGDQLLTLDGRDLQSVEQMADSLSARPAGTRVKFGVLRGGEHETLNATLAARSATSRDAELEGERAPARSGGGQARPNDERTIEPEFGPPDNSDAPPRSVLRRPERSSPAGGERAAGRGARESDVQDPRVLLDEIRDLQRLVVELQQRLESLEARIQDATSDGEPLPR